MIRFQRPDVIFARHFDEVIELVARNMHRIGTEPSIGRSGGFRRLGDFRWKVHFDEIAGLLCRQHPALCMKARGIAGRQAKPSSRSACAAASVAWPQSATSIVGVNQRSDQSCSSSYGAGGTPFRTGSSPAATFCIQASSTSRPSEQAHGGRIAFEGRNPRRHQSGTDACRRSYAAPPAENVRRTMFEGLRLRAQGSRAPSNREDHALTAAGFSTRHAGAHGADFLHRALRARVLRTRPGRRPSPRTGRRAGASAASSPCCKRRPSDDLARNVQPISISFRSSL